MIDKNKNCISAQELKKQIGGEAEEDGEGEDNGEGEDDEDEISVPPLLHILNRIAVLLRESY